MPPRTRPLNTVAATVSSREFNQDLSTAKRLAENGPLVITARGRPAHVLLSYTDYEALTGVSGVSLGSALGCGESADIEFEPTSMDLVAQAGDL